MLRDHPLPPSAGGLLQTTADLEPWRTAAEGSGVQVGHRQPKRFAKGLSTPESFFSPEPFLVIFEH